MGELRHPNVVRLVDFNEDLGFMAQEFMSGGTLAQRLQRDLPLTACRDITLQLLSGLAAAHQRGIVHRDIKPSNIFFDAAGAVKLGDFGVAHLQDSGQTQTGAFIGTLAYMAPEQITGADLTFACDLYALGVLLHRMVTGRLPFEPPDLVGQHLGSEPPRPSTVREGLPVAYDQVILRCLAKNPAQRHPSLDALRRAVEALPVERSLTDGSQAPEPQPARERREEDSDTEERYRVSVRPGAAVEGVEVLQAEDMRLGRPVQVVRATPGPGCDRAMALLQTAAADMDDGGSRHLQVVLEADPSRGWGVLAPCPVPAVPKRETRGQGLEICRQIARALAHLHRADMAHGAVDSPGAVATLDGEHTLLLGPALLAGAAAQPADDLAALGKLCGLEDLPADLTAQALGRWASGQLERISAAEEREAEAALYSDALERKPPKTND